jgi:hypothetical protein
MHQSGAWKRGNRCNSSTSWVVYCSDNVCLSFVLWGQSDGKKEEKPAGDQRQILSFDSKRPSARSPANATNRNKRLTPY